MIGHENLGKHCGVDEVGRGAWSGPVVAAAVRLNSCVNIKGLADSKTIGPALRVRLYYQIIENSAVGVSFVSSSIIDSNNILQASLQAMENAVRKILDEDEKVFFDGKALFFGFIDAKPCRTIINLPQKISFGPETSEIGPKVWFLASGFCLLELGQPSGRFWW